MAGDERRGRSAIYDSLSEALPVGRVGEVSPAVADRAVQDGLLGACYELTGEAIPDSTRTKHKGQGVDARACDERG